MQRMACLVKISWRRLLTGGNDISRIVSACVTSASAVANKYLVIKCLHGGDIEMRGVKQSLWRIASAALRHVIMAVAGK